MVKSLLERLSRKTSAKSEPVVTVEKLEQLLEYARRRNLCGQGAHGDWIGQSISITYEVRRIVPLPNNPVFQVPFDLPMYVSWASIPHALNLCLEDGQVVMRASHDGVKPPHLTPIAEDRADIEEIERCFTHWYEKFGLPGSLQVPTKTPPKFVPTGDAMADIRTYLHDGSALAFHELFEEGGPMVWIDWREDDADVVAAFGRALALDDLTARFDNDSCDLLIGYRATEHRVCYPEAEVADRDTTIRELNRLLLPDYAIRFCTASHGSDTLAFLPLSAKAWVKLESEFADRLDKFFSRIGPTNAMFGS